MADKTIVAPAPATSWGAVLGGWLATIGASVIFAPIVAGLIAAADAPQNPSDLALAVPVVLGILLSYIIGGYVAGRMAGYRTSWHGMMTAFFTLFIVLVVLLVGGLADRGFFAASGIRSLTDVVPGARLSTDSVGDALSFGAILGFLAAIFGGWLGGLLAPSVRVHATAPVVATTRTTPMRAFGRKGGERMEKTKDEVHTARVERG
jgi:putative membrane protein (TIGR04086 family)